MCAVCGHGRGYGGEQNPPTALLGSIRNYCAPPDGGEKIKGLNRAYALACEVVKRGGDKYRMREIMHWVENLLDVNAQEYCYKYARMHTAHDWVGQDGTKHKNQKVSQVFKISSATACNKTRGELVGVKRTNKFGTYVYSGTYGCGNVWLCPPCQARIAARRADEAQKFVEWAVGLEGKQVLHLTFTASHNVNLPLLVFGQRLQAAYTAWRRSRRVAKIVNEIGMTVKNAKERGLRGLPSIKSVEFTHSFANGWHKHFHALFVCDRGVDVGKYVEALQDAWVVACINHGLCDGDVDSVRDLRAHGLHVEWASDVERAVRFAQYIAKEVCSLATKVSRAKDGVRHRTVFELAIDLVFAGYNNDWSKFAKIKEAIAEFAFYVHALHQNDWSNGLKKLVGIADLSDKELLERQEDDATMLLGFLRPAYATIRKHGLYKDVLDVVSSSFDKTGRVDFRAIEALLSTGDKWAYLNKIGCSILPVAEATLVERVETGNDKDLSDYERAIAEDIIARGKQYSKLVKEFGGADSKLVQYMPPSKIMCTEEKISVCNDNGIVYTDGVDDEYKYLSDVGALPKNYEIAYAVFLFI